MKLICPGSKPGVGAAIHVDMCAAIVSGRECLLDSTCAAMFSIQRRLDTLFAYVTMRCARVSPWKQLLYE